MVKNLHPWFHGGVWSRPCLRWWVGSKALSFSRCVFLFAPELCGTPLSKTTPRSRPSSDEPGRGGPDHHDRRRRKTGCKSFRLASGNQRKAERRQTRSHLLALRQARTLQGALACRRSTAVLPLGLTHPKVRSRTRFRGIGPTMAGVSRRRQPRLQRAPRTPVIVPADMMSDTARVQRGRTLCARAPHPAPASRSHRLTSLHEEREAGAFSRRVRRVKPNHLARVSI
jgi:hypothetical protein